MVTSVKISDTHKRKLDRLREDLSRLRGSAVAAQDVLERLIDIGSSDPDIVIATYSRVKYPIPESRRKQSLALAGDWMGQTSEEDIDRTLYGGSGNGGHDRHEPARRLLLHHGPPSRAGEGDCG